jgi:hypothetical protein
MLQQSHADENAIVRLPEIGGAGIGIDVGGDLIDSWQRVKQDSFRVEAPHRIAVYHVLSPCGFILPRRRESFFLHPGLVDDVDVG